MSGKREFGDYQTPVDFAQEVCRYLQTQKGLQPTVVIEPTCGIGNFLKSSLLFNAEQYYGIEINAEYCAFCRKRFSDKPVQIFNSDFFTFNFKEITTPQSNILVVGNPPWVTNTTLSTLDSKNLPTKMNFKGLRGLEALTGASNFDICEYIILKLLLEFEKTDTTIAMLCKTSVARNVFKELKRNHVGFEYCELLEFDSAKVFGISASACVLIIKLSETEKVKNVCNVCSFNNAEFYPTSGLKYSLDYRNDQLITSGNTDIYDLSGKCCLDWRQGVKHDCSKIMELSKKNGSFYNGMNDRVDIEENILFPLVKSSMFKRPIIEDFSKYVLVTQRKIREETSYLASYVPKTWKYLNENAEFFSNRKSSIYRGAPQFAMFGVGDYSYSRYKVGVSGFYKKPLFSLLYSPDQKPVMTDDTGYFICFDSYNMGYVAMLLLNSESVQNFLMSIAFLDAKRPYTKKVLERICFRKIFQVVHFDELQKTETELNLSPYITEEMYSDFKKLPIFKQTQPFLSGIY
ncbi:MAG: methyltransferase [Planctomycetia bacterium]|nr:methyltransferase [Planctomycetia bacterium]